MGLALLYAVAFLASRVMVRVDAHTAFLAWVVLRSRGSPARLCLGVMVLTFVLSSFVPNVITVLAVLPVVGAAVDGLGLGEEPRRRLLTVLVLGVIYAANIGGMASLVGSPANGLLVLVLHEMEVPGRDALGFFRWLLFGVPMASVYLALAWAALIGIRGRALDLDVSRVAVPAVRSASDLRAGLLVIGATLAGCVVLALAEPHWGWLLGAALFYVAALLLIRLPDRRERILTLRGLYEGLPLRGIGFALAAAVAGITLERLGMVTALRDWLGGVLPLSLSPLAAMAILVTVTIFLTELISNTAAAIGMWAVAVGLAEAGGYSPLLPMLGIGLASTSAFMSPLATPASGLGFGGIRGVSLRAMLAVGLLVNLAGAAWIVLCLWGFVPWVLGL